MKKGLIEMLAAVKAKIITPITDEYDNVIGLNYNSGSTGMNYAKRVNGHMVVGATKEELEADEKALRQFMEDYEGQPIMHYFQLAVKLNKDTLTEEDIAELNAELDSYISRNTKVEVREVPVPAPASGRGKYENIPEELAGLSEESLRNLMNEAHRNGLRDLYNAVRKVRRANGVNC